MWLEGREYKNLRSGKMLVLSFCPIFQAHNKIGEDFSNIWWDFFSSSERQAKIQKKTLLNLHIKKEIKRGWVMEKMHGQYLISALNTDWLIDLKHCIENGSLNSTPKVAQNMIWQQFFTAELK